MIEKYNQAEQAKNRKNNKMVYSTRNSSGIFTNYSQNKTQELIYESMQSMSSRKGSEKIIQGQEDRPMGYTKHKEYLGNRESIIAVSKLTDVLPDEDLGIVGSREEPKDNYQDIQNKRPQIEKPSEQVNFQDMIKQRQIEVQKRLASIQKQVEQQTMELEQQRQNNKFMGLTQETFKPYKRNKVGKIIEEGPGGVNEILSLISPDPKKRYITDSTKHLQNQSLFEIKDSDSFAELQVISENQSAPQNGKRYGKQWAENEQSLSLQDEEDQLNSNMVQRPINTSDFVSGGLQLYHQSQHFTQQQIKLNQEDSLFSSTRKSLVNKNSIPGDVNQVQDQRFSMGLKKQASQMVLTNIYDKEFGTQPLQTVKNQYSYRANEMTEQDNIRTDDKKLINDIVTRRIDNVVLHPQDRKRLGLDITNEFEKSQSSTNRLVNQSQRSIKSPRKTLATQRSTKALRPSPQANSFVEGQRQNLAQMKSTKALENYVSEIDQIPIRRIENCSKNQNIANIKNIRNVINNSNNTSKQDDSIEEMPQPEATPSRIQQREFIKDFMVPEQPTIGIQSIQDMIDSDPDDTVIIDQKLALMKQNDEKMIQEKKQLLQLLISEEKNLFRYANDNIENIQNLENSRYQNLVEREDEIEIDYKQVVQRAGISKLRVMFFVRQLQISQILTSALIRVFVPSLLQKFQIKFQHVCANIHQNFLLMIDMILKELFMQTQANIPYDQLNKHEIFALTNRGANIVKTNEYQYLRQITDQRLRNKEKHAKTLTSFRQNNEVNIQNLKKVVKYVIDSYTQDCIAFKILAFDIQEIMKHHLSNIIANLNESNFQHLTESPFCTISYINSMINQRVNLLIGNRGDEVGSSNFQKIQFQQNPKTMNQNSTKRGKSNIKGTHFQNSALQKSSIINQNTYGGNGSSEQNSPAQIGSPSKLRMNDLINSGQGVLAGRKSPKKRSGHNDSIISGKHNQSIQSAGVRDKHQWSNKFQVDAQLGSPNFGVKLIKPDSNKASYGDQLQVPQSNKTPLRQYQSNSALGMAAATKKIAELQKRHGSGGSKSPLKISAMNQVNHQLQHNYPSPSKQSISKTTYGYGTQSALHKNSRPGSRQEVQSKPVNQTTGQGILRRQTSLSKLQQQQSSNNNIPRKATLQKSSSKSRLEAKHRNLINQKQTDRNSSNFMLPETLNFIRQQQNLYNELNNNNQSPFIMPSQQKPEPLKSNEMNENIKNMLNNIQNQNIVNINKSINFYGPVINHVYSSGASNLQSELQTPEYFKENLSNLQHLHKENEEDFDENDFINQQFENENNRNRAQTLIQNNNKMKQEEIKIQQNQQRKTYYELQRAKNNRSQNSYVESELSNAQDVVFNSRKASGKMTINQYLNNSKSAKALPNSKPSTLKSSIVEPYGEIQETEKQSVKTSILSQPSQQFSSPSKVGSRKMSGGSGIGTGTKNLAIRQNQLAQQRSSASKKSFFAGSTNIGSFNTPQVNPMGKTALLKMNYPPQIVPPRNVQTSMSESHNQKPMRHVPPRQSVLVNSSNPKINQAFFNNDQEDIESHMFQQPPKPIEFNKTKNIQHLKELSEFEQLEAEIQASDYKYPIFQTAPDMVSDGSKEFQCKEIPIRVLETSPADLNLESEDEDQAHGYPKEEPQENKDISMINSKQFIDSKEEMSFQIEMFGDNNQQNMTSQHQERSSNASNGFENLEKHVDADIQEIMLQEDDKKQESPIFEKSHITPTRHSALNVDDLEFVTKRETDPRNNKIRLSMRNSTSQENSTLTIPRNRARFNKKMFFGEFDATVDEGNSLANSQLGNNDNATVSNFIQSNNQSPAMRLSHGTQSNSFSPGIKMLDQQQNSGRPSLIQLQQVKSDYETNEPQSAVTLSNETKHLDDLQFTHGSPSRASEKLADKLIQNQYETNLPTECNNFEQEIDEAESPIRLSLMRESKPEDPLETIENQKAPMQIHTEENEIVEEQAPLDEVERPPQEPELVEVDQQNTEELDEQAQIDLEFRQLRELVTIPYLPPLETVDPKLLPKRKYGDNPYTLVLDLDETLIHFEIDETVDPEIEEPGYYLIRPGCIKFLNQLSEYYEVVVFTAAMPDYADWILDNVDRTGNVSHRLYRQHTTPHQDYAIKDLKNLGRDLSKTIIIDNLAENFNYTTPLNGIWVESWYDDMDDTVLSLLIPFLKEIVIHQLDVREVLTEHIKGTFLYGFLEEQKQIPPVLILVEEDQEYNKAQAEIQENTQEIPNNENDEQQQ